MIKPIDSYEKTDLSEVLLKVKNHLCEVSGFEDELQSLTMKRIH